MGTNLPEICKICNNSLKDPLMLTCFHSFCHKCLESSSAKEHSKCPTCHLDYDMPKNNLDNSEIVNLAKKSIERKCSNCEASNAFCIHCSFNYRLTFLEHKGKMLASHTSRQSSTNDETNVKKYPTCCEHSEMMTLYCEDCKVLVCARCLTLRHNAHKMKHITDYFEEVKDKFCKNIQTNEDILKSVVSSYKNSGFMMSANEIKASLLKKEIHERGDIIKKAVDSIVADLKEHLDEELRQQKKDADAVTEDLKNMERNLNAHIEDLKSQCKQLNYENLAETSQIMPCSSKNIPKYLSDFNLSLVCDLKEQSSYLKKAIGSIEKGVIT